MRHQYQQRPLSQADRSITSAVGVYATTWGRRETAGSTWRQRVGGLLRWLCVLGCVGLSQPTGSLLGAEDDLPPLPLEYPEVTAPAETPGSAASPTVPPAGVSSPPVPAPAPAPAPAPGQAPAPAKPAAVPPPAKPAPLPLQPDAPKDMAPAPLGEPEEFDPFEDEPSAPGALPAEPADQLPQPPAMLEVPANAEPAQIPARGLTPRSMLPLDSPLPAGRAGTEPKRAPLKPSSQPAEAAHPDADLGLSVPPGFVIEQFADDVLAHDIYCLTVDSRGRVMVAGAGYIRRLIDSDLDGKADWATELAAGPKNGAQGLYVDGDDVLAVGDAGLLRYRDANLDDRADGPTEVVVPFKTGGEHDTHSIQRGPDGAWYIIAGNMAEIDFSRVTSRTSPVRYPRAGVLMRMPPDFSSLEVLCDGLRNAYDFAFIGGSDVAIFDSDDERDISLPWFRPTRVFHSVITADHGWISKSWKRPDEYLESPPVIAALGRGSPTGVVCYQHDRFPEKYRGALFVLDWTYGRVMALPLQKSGSTYISQPEAFVIATGQHGFAPTDIEVGADGCLWISVGGRGTRGGVYRVRAADSAGRDLAVPKDAVADPLETVLSAPQPLASWSRAKWMPVARSLGASPFLSAALDGTRAASKRCRAIEILVELFDGLDATAVAACLADTDAQVRATAAWSLAGSPLVSRDTLLGTALADPDPLVARKALEACLKLGASHDATTWIAGLTAQLKSDQRVNRALAAQVVARVDQRHLAALAEGTRQSPAGVLAYAEGWLARSEEPTARQRRGILPLALQVLSRPDAVAQRLDAVRLLQKLLGDLGGPPELPAAFESYSSPLELSEFERDLDPLVARCAELFPTGDATVDREMSRLLAQIKPLHAGLLDRMLDQITDASPAVEDLHYLYVAASIPVPRTGTQRERIARSLVRIDPKFSEQKLPQDSSWNDRFKELSSRLTLLDPGLPAAIVAAPGFGRPGHVLLMSEFTPDLLPAAIGAFVQAIQADPDYPWNNDVVFVLGSSSDPAHRELLRQQWPRFAVRSALLMTLAEAADPIDRGRLIEGLESSPNDVLEGCLSGLLRMPPSQEPQENLALLRLARRMGADERERLIAQRALGVIEHNLKPIIPPVTTFSTEPAAVGTVPSATVVARQVAGWTKAMTKQWPKLAAEALHERDHEATKTLVRLGAIDWKQGSARRGAELFRARQCAQCHNGSSALGPDLAGVTNRFSVNDLFVAIVAPSRDISNRYQATNIETDDGKTHSGLIVYESVDGLLLRNALLQTLRIESKNIVERRPSTVSLMPAGLLKDLSDRDLADMYAYLQSLGRTRTPSPATATKPPEVADVPAAVSP